ncbi:universal stress protein [uncultured Methanobacterium sp.]|uniref:universal stress protein n=1 Tax=uncultured Methanobacterium sp. TaxID=176306 RepID=UPI002AA68FF4|nr:universal stress protein [uncultured Methanobacterium sp.]
MYKKILIPTDGSKHALKAAKHSLWLSNKSQGEIIVLHIVETSSFSNIRARDLKYEMKNMLKDEGDQAITEIIQMSRNNDLNVKIVPRVEEGSAADKILDVADEESVDLIIMGTSGKHGIDRFLIGSVAEKVVRNSTKPVMVVH